MKFINFSLYTMHHIPVAETPRQGDIDAERGQPFAKNFQTRVTKCS